MSSTRESRTQGPPHDPLQPIGAPPLVTLTVNGTKPGCGEGACGSCTILVDNRPVRACQHSVEDMVGASVTTIEGLATGGRLHPVQQAFVEVGAVQCGYCTPGMVLSVVALLRRDPDPDDEAVNEALSGNICRCGAYTRVRKAVHRAAELIAEPGVADDLLVPTATGSELSGTGWS